MRPGSNETEKESAVAGVVTSEFTIAPRIHAQQGLVRVFHRQAWIPALPVAALLIISRGDWRWAVVALALLFVVTPIAVMWVWIMLLGSHDAINDLHPHRVLLDSGGALSIEWSDGDKRPSPLTFAPGSIKRIDGDKTHLRLHASPEDKRAPGGSRRHGKSQQRVIFIPVSAFHTAADMQRFVTILVATGTEAPV